MALSSLARAISSGHLILANSLREGDAGSTSGLVALGRHDLVVECTKVLQLPGQHCISHTSRPLLSRKTSHNATSNQGGLGIKTYQSDLLPRSNVVGEGDSSAGTLALAHREILVEGRRALDAGRVGAHDLVDVVGSAVAGHAAQLGARGAGVVRAVGLDHVVLDERRRGPAVECEQRVAAGVEAA